MKIYPVILSGGSAWILLEGMYFLCSRFGFFSELLITEHHYGRHPHVLFILLLLVFTACAVMLLRSPTSGDPRRDVWSRWA